MLLSIVQKIQSNYCLFNYIRSTDELNFTINESSLSLVAGNCYFKVHSLNNEFPMHLLLYLINRHLLLFASFALNK